MIGRVKMSIRVSIFNATSLPSSPDSTTNEEFPSFTATPEPSELDNTSIISTTFMHGYTFKEKADLRDAIDFLHSDDKVLLAAETGNVEAIECYIRTGVNLHERDIVGRNALHLAVMHGNMNIVLALLEAGVDPNVKDNVGMTPLSLCLMRCPSVAMANILFDYGAKILPRTGAFDTGLFIQFAIMCGPNKEEANLLPVLVERGGCLVNDPGAPGGRQALHFAAMSNNCTLIKILLDLGADVFLTNHRNQTPKDVARTFKCREAAKLLEQYEFDQYLLCDLTCHSSDTGICISD